MKQSLQNLQCVTNIQNGRVWEERIITGHMLLAILFEATCKLKEKPRKGTERLDRGEAASGVGCSEWASAWEMAPTAVAGAHGGFNTNNRTCMGSNRKLGQYIICHLSHFFCARWQSIKITAKVVLPSKRKEMKTQSRG